MIKHSFLTITLTSIPILNPARSSQRPDNDKQALGFAENDLTTFKLRVFRFIDEV